MYEGLFSKVVELTSEKIPLHENSIREGRNFAAGFFATKAFAVCAQSLD